MDRILQLFKSRFASEISIEDAIYTFIQGLQDPLKPRYCGVCLVACLLIVSPSVESINRIQSHHRGHSFFSTAISFLTINRSPRDIKELDRRLSQCNCLSNDTILELYHPTQLVVCFGSKCGPSGSLAAMLTLLNDTFCYLEESGVNPTTVAKGRHRELWPTSPYDLVPHGAEHTIQSIIRWANFLYKPLPIDILSLVTRISRSLIVPALVSSPTVANYVMRQGTQICQDFSRAHNTDDAVKKCSAVLSFCVDISRIINFFNILMDSTIITGEQMRQFHQGHEKRLFQFASRGVALIESLGTPERQEMEDSAQNLADYAATLYLTFVEDVDLPHPSPGSTIGKAVKYSLDCTVYPPRTAHEVLCRFKDTQICFAIGCTSSSQTSGGQFQRCAQCRVVAYCSKDCQRRAWSDERLPHKQICKTIKRVVDAGGQYLQLGGEEKFARCVKAANIPDLLLLDIAAWFKGLGYTES